MKVERRKRCRSAVINLKVQHQGQRLRHSQRSERREAELWLRSDWMNGQHAAAISAVNLLMAADEIRIVGTTYTSLNTDEMFSVSLNHQKTNLCVSKKFLIQKPVKLHQQFPSEVHEVFLMWTVCVTALCVMCSLMENKSPHTLQCKDFNRHKSHESTRIDRRAPHASPAQEHGDKLSRSQIPRIYSSAVPHLNSKDFACGFFYETSIHWTEHSSQQTQNETWTDLI